MSEDVVTVRHRDSMEQDKVAIADLRAYLEEASRNWVRPTPKD
jgi:glycyl-tRNA synthetase (class II)